MDRDLEIGINYSGDQCGVTCFFCGNDFHPGLAQVWVSFPPGSIRRQAQDVCPACVCLVAREGSEALAQMLRDQAALYEQLAADLRGFADGELRLPTPEQLEAAQRVAHRLATYDEHDSTVLAELQREIGLESHQP
jgi:hypothetical protein